jgi:hypothetical protein
VLKSYFLLLFTIGLPYFSGAQDTAYDIVRRYSLQRHNYTPENTSFFIVHDSAIHRAKSTFTFRRKLADDYYIVSAAETDTSTVHVTAIANRDWKISPRLTDFLLARDTGWHGSLTMVVSAFDIDKCLSHLHSLRIQVDSPVHQGASLHITIKNRKELDAVLDSPWVTFIDVARSAPKEETLNSFHDLSVNGFSMVHDQYPEIDGSVLAVSVRERTVEKSDIDLKGRIIESAYEDPLISFHANQMATIIAGGGNSSPDSKGAAWAAAISSSSFESALPDDDEYFTDNLIKLQNHSYGYEIENYYGAEARAFDLQANRNKQLVHIFSAGNDGESTSSSGPYANILGFATLTGNMKSAKNVLVAGGHYKDFAVDTRNSRGPTYDGRLKPEIVAYGPEGTSDAAAYVSGAVALLQHAYQSKNGTLPNSALIRSVIAVTADDVHAEGIDFTTGFGAVNVTKSIHVIQNENFIEGDIGVAGQNSFELDIPENVKQLRIVLAWNDPAADAGSSEALVHDLDLLVRKSAPGMQWLPWLLNSYPHIDSLTKLPIRKKDRLNNIEFVSINKPEPGYYFIDISAGALESQQSFSIAYWFELAESFEWQYPVSSAALEIGSATQLRWNSSFDGTGDIYMRSDGGEFVLLSAEVDLTMRFHDWVVPASVSTVQFKMEIEGKSFTSPEIHLSKVQDVQVGFQCSEESMVFWNRVPGATQYVLYELGDKFMEPKTTSTDTSYFFISNTASGYFAVAPQFGTRPGKRGVTQYYKSLGVGCYSRSFTASLTDDSPVLTIELSTTYNVNRVRFERRVDGNYVAFDDLVVNNALSYSVIDKDFVAGVLEYRAVIILDDGREIITDPATLLLVNKDTFLIYPNPVSTGLSQHLNVLTDGKDVRLEVFDGNGKAVAAYDIVGMLFLVDVSDLAPGLYLYRFSRKGKIVKTGRCVVQ